MNDGKRKSKGRQGFRCSLKKTVASFVETENSYEVSLTPQVHTHTGALKQLL